MENKTMLDCLKSHLNLDSKLKYEFEDELKEAKECREKLFGEWTYAYDGYPCYRTHLPNFVRDWLGNYHPKGINYDDFFEMIFENKKFLYYDNGDKSLMTGTFKSEIANAMAEQLDNVINFLQKKLDKIAQAEAEERADYEAHKNDWQRIKTYKKVLPRGGENGVDGYIDADYKNTATGEVIRYVYRDVFDFGIYGYPKHAEGEGALEYKENETERALWKWLYRYGEFAGRRIRM